MKKVIVSILAFGPILAFAQQQPNYGYVEGIFTEAKKLVNLALPLVVGLALLGFFWGLAQFIFAAGSDERRAEGKQKMLWGIIGLFVMVSVWGLVGFVGSLFGVQQQGGSVAVPTVQNL